MTSLLILQCGNKKRSDRRPLPAIQMYRSPPIRMVALASLKDVEVYILSAEYGLIPGWQVIEPYDRIIDETRATQLCKQNSRTHRLIKEFRHREWDETLALCNTLYYDIIEYCDSGKAITLYKGTWFQQMHRLKAFIGRHSNSLVRS